MAVTSKKRERRLGTRLTKRVVEFDFETTAKCETKQLTVEAEIKIFFLNFFYFISFLFFRKGKKGEGKGRPWITIRERKEEIRGNSGTRHKEKSIATTA